MTTPQGTGQKHDAGKARYDLIPPGVLHDLARVLTHGAEKYAPGNWMRVAEPEARYYAAMMRHLEAWRMGLVVDPESGLPHLAHALCCLVFLAAFSSGEARLAAGAQREHQVDAAGEVTAHDTLARAGR